MVYDVICLVTPPSIGLQGRSAINRCCFEYTIKLVLFVVFFGLVLYRLVSRLGMHLSKMAQEHEWISPTFTALTQVGPWLLNVVAILLFLALVWRPSIEYGQSWVHGI